MFAAGWWTGLLKQRQPPSHHSLLCQRELTPKGSNRSKKSKECYTSKRCYKWGGLAQNHLRAAPFFLLKQEHSPPPTWLELICSSISLPVNAQGLKAFGRFQWSNWSALIDQKGKLHKFVSRTWGLRRKNTNQWECVFATMSFQWTETVGLAGKYPGKGLHPDPHFTPALSPESSCHDCAGPLSVHLPVFTEVHCDVPRGYLFGDVGGLTLSSRPILSKVAMCCTF